MKPIYLFADSQLLFWKPSETRFLERLRDDVEGPRKAAYIGASNGDQPEFFSIFQAAMEGIGIRDSRMVLSEPSDEQRASLEEADLILLAGGDPVRGWRVMERNGVWETVARRYYEGAVLCGVSAGAIQLGWTAYTRDGRGDDSPPRAVATSRFVPCVIDVHDEANGWRGLQRAVRKLEPGVKAIGIPSGGGLVFHSEDNSIEPLRRPLHEFTASGEPLEEHLLFPAGENIDFVTLSQGVTSKQRRNS